MTYNIIQRITLYRNNIIRHIILHKKETEVNVLVFNTGSALLDAIVLAVVAGDSEGTYGYKITQDVRSVIELSESTLYPVLRRLLKDECLESYDRQFNGRNRRYYKITERGGAQLALYRSEWLTYSSRVTSIFMGKSSQISDEEEKDE